MSRAFANRSFLRPAVIIVAVLLAAAAAVDVGLLVNFFVQAKTEGNDGVTWGIGILYVILFVTPAFLITAALTVLVMFLRRRLKTLPS